MNIPTHAAAGPDTATEPPLRGSSLAIRASSYGTVAVGALGGIAISTGLLPEGGSLFVVYGVLAAALMGVLGTVVKAYAVARPAGGDKDAQRFMIAVVGDFLIQLFAMGITVLALNLAGVKFSHLASFALAFAGAAFGFQMSASFVLSRALHQRATRAAAKANSSIGTVPQTQDS